MPTRDIVPRADLEGQIGTSEKRWANIAAGVITLATIPGEDMQAIPKIYVDSAIASGSLSPFWGRVGTEISPAYPGDGVVVGDISTQDIVPSGNITPASSGNSHIGSPASAFASGYIDGVYLSADPIDPLQAATKQYVDDNSGSSVAEILEIEALVSAAYSTAYSELSYTGSNVVAVDIWDTNGKAVKLFSRTLAYTGNNVSTVTTVDELNSRTLTTTLTYAGNNVSTITKAVT